MPVVFSQTTPMPKAVPPDFEERGAAWQARGAARTRALRRKLAIAAPLLAILAAVTMYIVLLLERQP
jgi:small-conductance mechanosensitive channel